MTLSIQRLERCLMADRRIHIAKDKMDFVKSLLIGENDKGLFSYQYDVLSFAAVLGANRDRKSPLGETTKDPIRQEVFNRQGYDTIINLLAVFNSNDPNILANSDEMEDKRATIFEEYANGGLEILSEEVKGSLDYLDDVLLMIAEQRRKFGDKEEEGFDLAQILEDL